MTTILNADFGGKFMEARQYARDNPTLTLEQTLQTYPARFLSGEAPTPAMLARPVEEFLFQPLTTLEPGEGQTVGGRPGPANNALRQKMDRLWVEEQARRAEAIGRLAEPDEYPSKISEPKAVHIAYRREMDAIADFLKHGMSVLVVADKMLTEFIYDFVVDKAGKAVVLDSDLPGEREAGEGEQTERAVQGDSGNPLEHLPANLHNLKPEQTLVIRSLDLLDNPASVELLYQRTVKGTKPQLLAFLDPSLEVKKVLSNRFDIHIQLLGLPRHTTLDGKKAVYTVTHLLTEAQRACFKSYDPEGLYKNVAGLNAIQFRSAMQYVAAKLAPNAVEARHIYRHIRQFKTSAGDEIDIPDTGFDDIGGYQEVKHQLQQIIALIGGPIEGIDEKQRSQLIPRGFIFHGPPGTGKTLFAKAIANEMNATIQMISGPEIMDKYVGQSENNLRRVFATARRNAPAVVFFDEFDSLASQRSTYSDGGARANNAVVAQLLTEMDGFRQEQAVLVIGTTNRIDIIDEALIRPSRMRPIEINLPDTTARRAVADIHARNFGVDRLLKDLCALAADHLPAWKAGKEQTIPPDFLEDLFAHHPPYRKRYHLEQEQAGFARDLRQFFQFVQSVQGQDDLVDHSQVMAPLRRRLAAVGRHYGLTLNDDDLTAGANPADTVAVGAIQSDLQNLFQLLQQTEQKAQPLNPATFYIAVLDLVAEYTDQFNNDEIRAIFQEASLEHHLEGQLITPRYLGQKIGIVRNRRDERLSIHLTDPRGGRR